MGRHRGRLSSTEEFLAGDYANAQRLNGWADAGGPDSALARGWRRLSGFAQPATAQPPADECPDCSGTSWSPFDAVRRCTGCGQLRQSS